jgi:hypothetical protein
MSWSTCCLKTGSNIAKESLKRCHVRSLKSAALHFYQNRQLELYASKEAKRLTLRQLVHNHLCLQISMVFLHINLTGIFRAVYG